MKRNITIRLFVAVGILLTAAACSCLAESAVENTPNRFSGTDSQRIAAAIADAGNFGGLVKIPARIPDTESDRNYWLIDSAILIPANTTIIFENCKVKLSDSARDNFIRTANVMPEYKTIEPIENIHIIGVGDVVFEGADHPRSTGDSFKKLSNGEFHEGARFASEGSYGTDAGKEGERQFGDWRNLGILLVKLDRFTLKNITIRQPHAWSVLLERCSNGHISDLRMFAKESKTIDGRMVKTYNLDGFDMQKGCHHLLVENLSGETGDDFVAFTAIEPEPKDACNFDCYGVSEVREEYDNDIHHIILRNVIGHSNGGHQIIRLLNTPKTKIHHILIDGVVDNSPEGVTDNAAVLIGDTGYGGPAPVENTYDIVIRNVQTKAWTAVNLREPIRNSLIDGVISDNSDGQAVHYDCDSNQCSSLILQNILNADN